MASHEELVATWHRHIVDRIMGAQTGEKLLFMVTSLGAKTRDTHEDVFTPALFRACMVINSTTFTIIHPDERRLHERSERLVREVLHGSENLRTFVQPAHEQVSWGPILETRSILSVLHRHAFDALTRLVRFRIISWKGFPLVWIWTNAEMLSLLRLGRQLHDPLISMEGIHVATACFDVPLTSAMRADLESERWTLVDLDAVCPPPVPPQDKTGDETKENTFYV